ncbi:MAG: hypothetical protein U0183_22495 [Polyangiaceae bacterium]
MSSLEDSLRSLASDFATRLVSLAADELERELRDFSPPPPRARPASVLPGKPSPSTTKTDTVDALVECIRGIPWPASSLELRRLLGLSKRTFLRIADQAIREGRIERRGFKATSRYYLPSR